MKAIFTLLILFPLLYCVGKNKALTTEPTQAPVTITFYSGEGTVLRNGESIVPQQGMQLGSDDQIRTGKTGRMEILVRNSGLIKVSSNSSLSVSSLYKEGDVADTNIHLYYGQIVTVVKKEKKIDNYNVVTPTLVAGVRGTIFSTTVENLESKDGGTDCSGSNCFVKIQVIDGKIAVRKKNAKDEVILDKNTQLATKGSEEIVSNSVIPLGKENLGNLKDLLVFHKDSLGGFENLIEEAKENSQILSDMDRHSGLEDSKKVLTNKSGSRVNDELRKVAEEIDTRKYLEKDLAKEKLKLESKGSF